jgi:hypothetical protein
MRDHFRYSGLTFAAQRDALEAIIRSSPLLMEVLAGLRDDGLPDHLLVAGAIYNVDVFYYDASDLSWDAEDVVIKRLDTRFAHLPLPVQVRNQARVHLWFPQKFGTAFEPLTSSAEMLGRYASETHSVGARLDADDTMTIVAPFGLDHIFSMRIVPNPVLANKKAHEAKAARAQSMWPEVTVLPWPDGAP